MTALLPMTVPQFSRRLDFPPFGTDVIADLFVRNAVQFSDLFKIDTGCAWLLTYLSSRLPCYMYDSETLLITSMAVINVKHS